MDPSRRIQHLALAAWLFGPPVSQQSPLPAAEAAVQALDLSRERMLVSEARSASAASDYSTARRKSAEAVTSLISRPDEQHQREWMKLLCDAGSAASGANDLAAARLAFEAASKWCRDRLPDEEATAYDIEFHLAAVSYNLDDLQRAQALYESVFEFRSRTLPAEHDQMQRARLGLALVHKLRGELRRAYELEEHVVRVWGSIYEEDEELRAAKLNLAATMYMLGDLDGARSLFEHVHRAFSRTLPDVHPSLQWARGNLAVTLSALGDLSGARALEEKVLEVRSRTLPDDHSELQSARMNLAGTLDKLGDLEGARALWQRVLDIRARSAVEDDVDLQKARWGLAVSLKQTGDYERARVLESKVVESFERILPQDHKDLQAARLNLAVTLALSGDLRGARALSEVALEASTRIVDDQHPLLREARMNVARVIARSMLRTGASSESELEADAGRCIELVEASCLAQAASACAAQLTGSSREAEERCVRATESLDAGLTFAGGYGGLGASPRLDEASVVLGETLRGAAIAAARIGRISKGSPRYAGLREELRAASDSLAAAAQRGTTGPEFLAGVQRRETAQRGLAALAEEISGSEALVSPFDVERYAAAMAENEAAVVFYRYARATLEMVEHAGSAGERAIVEKVEPSLCAMILRPGERGLKDAAAPVRYRLTRVDLGPIEPIERAAQNWRRALGVDVSTRGSGVQPGDSDGRSLAISGQDLRRRVLDPLFPVLRDASRVICVVDDVLNLIPLDALPLEEAGLATSGAPLVGDQRTIEMRCALTDCTVSASRLGDAPALLVVGGVAYLPTPVAATGSMAVETADQHSVEPRPVEQAGILRGGSWSAGFEPLPGSDAEALAIARCYSENHGEGSVVQVLRGEEASRERFQELAPRASWLHVATHAWFAPESIPSWNDPSPIDAWSGLVVRAAGAEQVSGMSPMLLCGLAFAGASSATGASGRVPGLVTAEEISALDLSNCELAVLSACDTNVGVRRAGQGVASLQRALHMAGARNVLTSLWKVPDEATAALMASFYRRLWRDRQPQGQALWDAKQELRNAVDAGGRPRYATRDWAAWVLTSVDR